MNAIIVDDENKACANLMRMLETYSDYKINILGVANATSEAEQLIRQHNPDVVFLDIEMPDENAFEFLDRLPSINFEIIFVTAYDEFAIRAFRLNAIDYILKPIRINDLKNAVIRLRERIHYKRLLSQHSFSYTGLSQQLSGNKLHSITVKDLEKMEVIPFQNICYVEANGSYSKFNFLKGSESTEMLSSYPLSYYDELLPTDIFFRIHRSYILNCNHIRNLSIDGYHVVTMQNITLPVSRRRFPILVDFLKEGKRDKSS